jgi:hypothetical protein
VSYLQCPECRLTVPAAAYYLRGDQCPRCLTSMAPYQRKRFAPGTHGSTSGPARSPLPGSSARDDRRSRLPLSS